MRSTAIRRRSKCHRGADPTTRGARFHRSAEYVVGNDDTAPRFVQSTQLPSCLSFRKAGARTWPGLRAPAVVASRGPESRGKARTRSPMEQSDSEAASRSGP